MIFFLYFNKTLVNLFYTWKIQEFYISKILHEIRKNIWTWNSSGKVYARHLPKLKLFLKINFWPQLAINLIIMHHFSYFKLNTVSFIFVHVIKIKNDNIALHFDIQIWKYLRDHKTCSDKILEQFQKSTIMIWSCGRKFFFTPEFGKFDQTQPIYPNLR